MNNNLSNTNNRNLILQLASLTLLKPVVHMTGLVNLFGGPIISNRITTLVSIIWIIAVMTKGVEKPLKTLVLTGMAGGVYVVIFGSIFSPIFNGGFLGLIANPFAIAGAMVTNTFWGFMTGIFAALLYKLTGLNKKVIKPERI
jgi:hypothetical protein